MDSPYYTHIVKTLIDQSENHRGAIMNIAGRLKNEGKEETLQQVVLKSLQLGLSIDIISTLTGLSLAEIQALSNRPLTMVAP